MVIIMLSKLLIIAAHLSAASQSELAILCCRASIMASGTEDTQALKSLFIKAALNFAFACL